MIEIKDKNGKDLNIGDTVMMHNKPMKVSSFTITRNYFIVTCTSSCIEYSDRSDEVELVEPDSWEKFQNELMLFVRHPPTTSMGKGYAAEYFTDRAKKLAAQ